MHDIRLVVFDTYSIFFRAFHGLPRTLRSQDGVSTNAVRGLLDAMASLITKYRPSHLACAWDQAWRPTWRVALLPEYKSHRLAQDGVGEQIPQELAVQIPLIIQALDLLSIPRVGLADHEADDVMASLARSFGGEALVVSGDRDLFQVVNDLVRVVYLGRGVAKHELVDEQWIANRYGVAAKHFVDFAVLRGDPSDGLRGIAGIGEKTAAALITRFGPISGILAAAADKTAEMPRTLRERILAGTDYIQAAVKVVRAIDNLDLAQVERFDPTKVDLAGFRSLADRLNLGRSADRILAALQS